MQNIQISLCNVKCDHESQATKFHKIQLNTFRDIIHKITIPSLPWSPNIFSDGYRRGKSFAGCDLLVFDYDNGTPTINQAADFFSSKGLAHIIGTTKSHQKEKIVKGSKKIKPPCDRFRVVIPAVGFANNIAQFNYQMRMVSKHIKGVDTSCAEGARFYWPCTDIVKNNSGDIYKAVKPKSLEYIAKKIEKLKKDDLELGKCGYIPDEIRAFIRIGAVQGERRPSLFKYAARLTRLGWCEGRIYSALLEAPFYKEDLNIDDMMRQIKRGILYGKGNEGYAV